MHRDLWVKNQRTEYQERLVVAEELQPSPLVSPSSEANRVSTSCDSTSGFDSGPPLADAQTNSLGPERDHTLVNVIGETAIVSDNRGYNIEAAPLPENYFSVPGGRGSRDAVIRRVPKPGIQPFHGEHNAVRLSGDLRTNACATCGSLRFAKGQSSKSFGMSIENCSSGSFNRCRVNVHRRGQMGTRRQTGVVEKRKQRMSMAKISKTPLMAILRARPRMPRFP